MWSHYGALVYLLFRCLIQYVFVCRWSSTLALMPLLVFYGPACARLTWESRFPGQGLRWPELSADIFQSPLSVINTKNLLPGLLANRLPYRYHSALPSQSYEYDQCPTPHMAILSALCSHLLLCPCHRWVGCWIRPNNLNPSRRESRPCTNRHPHSQMRSDV